MKQTTKVYIPHIHYTVNLKDSRNAKGDAKEFLETFLASTERVDKNTSIIHMKLPINKINIGTLAHELVHVLQNICYDRNISFIKEQESTAYIYHFMFNELTGYKYE